MYVFNHVYSTSITAIMKHGQNKKKNLEKFKRKAEAPTAQAAADSPVQ